MLNKEAGWYLARFPVRDEETGETTWPEKWPDERIERETYELGPLESARSLFCKPRAEGENPFDQDAIENAFVAGNELELVRSLDVYTLPHGAAIVHGVDLAVTKTKGSHLTAIITLMLWPEDWSRQLLWVESGKWSSREIRDRILDHTRRYKGSYFVVENNAAQRWIFDIIENQADLELKDRVMPELVPFTTGMNKAHPQFGVEGVAVEIANGKWLFPTTGPGEVVKNVDQLRGEMEFYSRGAHTGDRLMAMWLAREGARRGRMAGRSEAATDDDENSLTPPAFNATQNVGARIFS